MINLAGGSIPSENLGADVLEGLWATGDLKTTARSSLASGWLWCDGAAVSRSTYAALFTEIGTTFGVGNGTTTFNVPDLRGRTLAGLDNLGGVSANRLSAGVFSATHNTLGAAAGTEKADADLAAHTHGVGTLAGALSATLTLFDYVPPGDAGTTVMSVGYSTTSNGKVNRTGMGSVTGSTTLSGATASAGAAGGHNNMQPTMLCNIVIKT